MTASVPRNLSASNKRRTAPRMPILQPRARRKPIAQQSAPPDKDDSESIAHSKALLMLQQDIVTEAEDITLQPSTYEPSKALPVKIDHTGHTNVGEINELKKPSHLRPAKKDKELLSSQGKDKSEEQASDLVSSEDVMTPAVVSARDHATLWARELLQDQFLRATKQEETISTPKKRRRTTAMNVSISEEQFAGRTIAELALSVPNERTKQRSSRTDDKEEETHGSFSKHIRSSFDNASAVGSVHTMLTPQVQIVNGQMVLTQASVDVKMHLDPSDDADSKSDSMKRNQRFNGPCRGKRWGRETTRKFYHCLSQVGTNFSMMAVLFPDRSRKELKRKFNKEAKSHPKLIDLALTHAAAPIDEEVLDVITKLVDREAQAEGSSKDTSSPEEQSTALPVKISESPRSEITFDSDLSLIHDDDDELPSFDYDNDRSI